MNFQVYYNSGTVVRVDYNIIDGAGNTIPMSKYYSLPLQQEIDPNTTPLTLDVPQPFQQTNELCCVSGQPTCLNQKCGLAKALDNNWVIENAVLFDKKLSVELDYLIINGDTVITSQAFEMPADDILTYIDTNGMTLYSNLFDWLKPIFASFEIYLELGSINIDGNLVEVMYFNYDPCKIQSYEFKLIRGFKDEVKFEQYVANETGYIEVQGLTSDFILYYYKREKLCI